MSETEKEEFIKIMQGVNNTQNAIFNGHFEAIKIELNYIKEKGDKTFEQATHTNGRVSKHDVDIALINSDKKNWKQRLAYDSIVLCIALMAGYLTISNATDLFASKNDIIEAKIESKVIDKVQDLKINDNKDAINEQGVENAFQYNKRKIEEEYN